MKYINELNIAIKAVRQASIICSNVQRTLDVNDTVMKNDRSPVTIADLASQAVIIHAIQAQFPDERFVAEEDSSELTKSSEINNKVIQLVRLSLPTATPVEIHKWLDSGSAPGSARERFWTLDPIDGTKGFLRKEQYAIALALIENGEVQLGVLGCPNLYFDKDNKGVLFYAIRGQGAYVLSFNQPGSRQIQVDSVKEPQKAVLCESVERSHAAHGQHKKITEALGITAPPYQIDSQCKYGVVARGDSSIYLRMPRSQEYEEKIWDHAAGVIIVEEAGGKVTDVHDNYLDFGAGRTLKNNRGIVATNGHLHDKTIQSIANLLNEN